MKEYKSIKVSDETLRWVRRLKGILEHAAAEPITMDQIIGGLAVYADYVIAQQLGITLENESFVDYAMRINEKLGIIQDQNIVEQLELFNFQSH